MLVAILVIAVGICAVGLVCSKISMMALLYFMDEKGYAFPTKSEMHTFCRKATERMFKRRLDEK